MIEAQDRSRSSDGLDSTEKETSVEIRERDLERSPLDDETINRIADESFLGYDAQEAEDAGQGQS